jgi:hypothetical protein
MIETPTKILKLKKSSHSCFYEETDHMIVTVYSKTKKKLRLYEINTALDIAKAKVIDRMMDRQ